MVEVWLDSPCFPSESYCAAQPPDEGFAANLRWRYSGEIIDKAQLPWNGLCTRGPKGTRDAIGPVCDGRNVERSPFRTPLPNIFLDLKIDWHCTLPPD